MASRIPIGLLLYELGLAVVVEGDVEGACRLWLESGHVNYDTHAACYLNEEGQQTLTVFDCISQEAWRLEDQSHSLTSFGWLIRVPCEGDVELAARIAAKHADDLEGLLDALDETSVEDLRRDYPPSARSDTAFERALRAHRQWGAPPGADDATIPSVPKAEAEEGTTP